MSATDLFVDLGNTRLKWARCADNGSPGLATAFAHGDDDGWHAFEMELRNASPAIVWVASVAPAGVEARLLSTVSAAAAKAAVKRLQSPAACGSVRNAYAEPKRLGIDRFLALVAAHSAFPGPALVVSAGTALTVDALAADGEHLGGLIAPGIALSQDALIARSGRVEKRAEGSVDWLGRSTESCLASGAWTAAAGMVERSAAEYQRRLGVAPRLLLHGGDATALAARLGRPAEVVDGMVLFGLALWRRAPPASRS